MELDIPDVGRRVRPGKILCIGRNYAAHAAEMKSAVPEVPMIFLKPSSALVGDGGQIRIPSVSRDVHHEVELVVAIGRQASHVDVREAAVCVAAYAVGIDMTARDIQAEAKRKGHPWSVSKGFDTFAPIGRFKAADLVGDPAQLRIRLHVNDELRQEGQTGDMIFSVPELVAYASSVFTLEPGDLLYTGTPDGVGPVVSGDRLRADVTGLEPLSLTVL